MDYCFHVDGTRWASNVILIFLRFCHSMTGVFPFHLNLHDEFTSLNGPDVLRCMPVSTEFFTDLCDVDERDISTYFVCKQRSMGPMSVEHLRHSYSKHMHLNGRSLVDSGVLYGSHHCDLMDPPLHTCPECPTRRIFTSRNTLRKHIQNCHGTKPNCPHCRQQIRADNMSRHIRKYCPRTAVQATSADEDEIQKYLLDTVKETEVAICLNGISIL